MTSSQRASGRSISPCSATDATTTKNTTSNSRSDPTSPAAIGNVANTIGTPPRSPAAAMNAISRRGMRSGSRQMAVASGRATSTSARAMMIGREPASNSRDGVTSRPSRTNSPICATQAVPCRKPRITGAVRHVRAPTIRPARYAESRPEPPSAALAV